MTENRITLNLFCQVLYNLAKAVNFKEVKLIFLMLHSGSLIIFCLFALKTAIFCALENGFKISCEDAKCTQGIAFVHSDLFQEYTIKGECICIKINLSILIECLNIFGASMSGVSTALRICYEGYGHPLTLL